jgi:hypothetical protein
MISLIQTINYHKEARSQLLLGLEKAKTKINIINKINQPEEINQIIYSYLFIPRKKMYFKCMYNLSIKCIKNAFMSRKNLFRGQTTDENDPHWSFCCDYGCTNLQLQAINCPKCGNYIFSHNVSTIYCQC